MEDKFLGFQLKYVSAKPFRPSYKFTKLRHFLQNVKLDLEYGRSGVYRSGRLQVFSKISVIKSFKVFTKNTCAEFVFNRI